MSFFSIIIPTYNRAHIIRNAIEAVQLQTFTDFELIISDDGSTDNTEEIVLPLLKDSRIKYIKQINKGVCAARNFGAQDAKGKYLVFLDSDDTINDNWLYDFHNLAQKNFDIVFCSMVVCAKEYNEPECQFHFLLILSLLRHAFDQEYQNQCTLHINAKQY